MSPIRYAGVKASVDVLAPSSADEPCVVLFGAGASNPLPSGLPFANPWKKLLLTLLCSVAKLPEHLAAGLAEVSQSSKLKLEAIFQSCDHQASGKRVGTTLAMVTKGIEEPNALHEIVADGIISGSVRAILTTNWDGLLEAALRERGIEPDVWVAPQAWRADAALYKLHGSQDSPGSLRHTFETINQRFEADVVAGLRSLSSARLVALGYDGTDYDVIDALGSGGAVYWLHAAPLATLEAQPNQHLTQGARELAARRDVVAIGGGFQELASAMGREWTGLDLSGDRILAASIQALGALTLAEATSVVGDVSFRVCVSDPNYRVAAVAGFARETTVAMLDEFFMRWLRSRRRMVGQSVWLANAAGRDHHYGRRIRAAARFIGIAMMDRARARRALSDAGDAIEIVANGLVPFTRALALPLHRRAASADPSDLWVAFRYARCVAATCRHRKALQLFDEILRSGPLDPFIEAHVRRRRALSLSACGLPGWEPELEAAKELFEFERRSHEMASLLRSWAVCSWLTGDEKRAKQLLDVSDGESPVKPSRARNRAIRRAMKVPVIGKTLVRAIV